MTKCTITSSQLSSKQLSPHQESSHQKSPNQLTNEQLEHSWPAFSEQILDFMAELNLDTLKLNCDHVALRVNSVAAADSLSTYFAKQGNVISNNIINGRPILIIELDTPMRLGEMLIECVELPYPSDKPYPVEGWEHIELVLPSEAQTCEQLQHELLAVVPQLGPILAGQTTIKVKQSSPKGEHERLANPTIAFKRDNLCIKIHSHGIKAVIASEAK
ncbi:VOC family protein [Shewanella mesophila]|uniref:VOC family protein n=1 Tax=Shewanella mesophila TaxID=2864208 RepID=UPI001C656C1B|nr:VOC family protein [Shewanella mesophila]QYJ84924.1 VOC family protein [Shewanella mesophila]